MLYPDNVYQASNHMREAGSKNFGHTLNKVRYGPPYISGSKAFVDGTLMVH